MFMLWLLCWIQWRLKKKDPNFEVGNHVRISKYKNIFAKEYAPNWSEEAFVVSKIKNAVPWTYIVNDLSGEEITGSFYEKELQKTNQEKFRIEKVRKRKGDELYVKWKGYDNCFNSWIDKKDLEWNLFNRNFFKWNWNFKWNFLNEIFWMTFFKWKFLNESFLITNESILS